MLCGWEGNGGPIDGFIASVNCGLTALLDQDQLRNPTLVSSYYLLMQLVRECETGRNRSAADVRRRTVPAHRAQTTRVSTDRVRPTSRWEPRRQSFPPETASAPPDSPSSPPAARIASTSTENAATAELERRTRSAKVASASDFCCGSRIRRRPSRCAIRRDRKRFRSTGRRVRR